MQPLAQRQFDDDLMESAESIPEFAVDYVKLHARHAARFASTGMTPDPRLRDAKKGFSKWFFHTHAAGEVCHLE